MTSWSEADRVRPLSAAATALEAPKHPIAAAKYRWRNFIAGEHDALFPRAKAQLRRFSGTLQVRPLDDGGRADEGVLGVNYGGSRCGVHRGMRNRCDLY